MVAKGEVGVNAQCTGSRVLSSVAPPRTVAGGTPAPPTPHPRRAPSVSPRDLIPEPP